MKTERVFFRLNRQGIMLFILQQIGQNSALKMFNYFLAENTVCVFIFLGKKNGKLFVPIICKIYSYSTPSSKHLYFFLKKQPSWFLVVEWEWKIKKKTKKKGEYFMKEWCVAEKSWWEKNIVWGEKKKQKNKCESGGIVG